MRHESSGGSGMRSIVLIGLVSLAAVGSASAQAPPISRAQVQVERAYYLKQAADEIFIRRKARIDEAVVQAPCAGVPDWLEATCKYVERESRDEVSKEWRRAAMRQYVEAAIQLDRAVGKASGAVAGRLTLLQKDIAYRAKLLQLDQDFWGSTAFGVPGIPAIQLNEMREALNRLEGLAAEINALQDRSEDKAFQQLQTAASAVSASSDVQSTLPNTDKLEHAKREAQQRIASANEQIDLSIARQKEVEAQQGRLKSQAEQISNGFAKSLATAASSYLGVPPDLTRFANGKPLKDNLKDALTAHAADILSDPELLSNFGELGQTAYAFNKKIEDVKSQYAGQLKKIDDAKILIEKTEGLAEDIKTVLRSPSAENLSQIGVRTLARLDPAAAAKLKQSACTLLEQSKPFRAVLEQAKNPSAVSDRIRAEIAKQIPDFAGAKLAAELRLYTSSLALPQKAAWIGSALRRISALPSDVAEEANQAVRGEIARAVLRFWPRSVVALLSPARRSQLFDQLRQQYKQLGLLNETELLDKLRSDANFRVDVTGSAAVLTVAGQSYALGSFEALLQAGELADAIQVNADQIDAELEKILDRLQNTGPRVRAALLQSVPFDRIEKGALALSKDIATTEKLWDSTVGKLDSGLSCTAPASVASRVADMQVGSLMVEQLASARRTALEFPPNANGEKAPGVPSAPSDGDPNAELVKQAIIAAFPGYGTAVNLAVEFIKGFQQVASLANQIADLTAEATRLTQHEMEQRAIIDASNMALELGILEDELGRIRRGAAVEQFSLLTRATQAAGAQQQRGLQRIENRLPQFFYMAEQLREKYDELDRAISLWGPAGGTVRDTIKQLITEDPGNLRLALDNDIQLFAWTDRDEERNRTDVDRVLTHWRQLYQLASDVCARIGCIPGRSQIGHVQQTELIDLCFLMSASSCSNLRNWMDHPTGTFNVDLTIPIDGMTPDYAVNARVIDVRLGGFDLKGQPIAVRNAILSHPGVSFIKTEDQISRETFRPAQSSSLEWPVRWELDAVSGRWNTAAPPRRLAFEGYGLNTVWRLSLRPWSGLTSFDRKTTFKDSVYTKGLQSGLFIRFAYSHQIRTTENVFTAEGDQTSCRVVLSMGGPARPDFASIAVSPAMTALASTQSAPVGRPWRPTVLADGKCPRLPSESTTQSFAGNLRATPILLAEQRGRTARDAMDFLGSCVGRPRRGVRLDTVVGMWFASEYRELIKAFSQGAAGALKREEICTKVRHENRLAWWTK